jgi:hypothetical protein
MVIKHKRPHFVSADVFTVSHPAMRTEKLTFGRASGTPIEIRL